MLSVFIGILFRFIFHEILNLLTVINLLDLLILPVMAPWHLSRTNLWGTVFDLFTDTLDRTLGDKRHLVTVELEAKPVETSSLLPVIEYAASVAGDLSQASREAFENGVHSACLQGEAVRSVRWGSLSAPSNNRNYSFFFSNFGGVFSLFLPTMHMSYLVVPQYCIFCSGFFGLLFTLLFSFGGFYWYIF